MTVEDGLLSLKVFLAIMGGVYALLLVFGPLVTWGTFNIHADQPLKEIPLELLPPKLLQAFSRVAPALAAAGFRCTVAVEARGQVSGSDGYVALWVNDSTNDTVQVISAVSALETVLTIGFITSFDDGTLVATSNATSTSVFRRLPNEYSVQLPGIWDMGLLYKIHAARVSHFAKPGSVTCAVAGGSEIGYLDSLSARVFDSQVQEGLLHYSAATHSYRPTFTGAFLMTWSQVWPISFLKREIARRNSVSELKRLGFDTSSL